MDHLFELPGPPTPLSLGRSYPPRPEHAAWRAGWNAGVRAASLLIYDSAQQAPSPVFFLQVGSPEREQALRYMLELLTGCSFFLEPLTVAGVAAGGEQALARQLRNEVDAFVAAANELPVREAVAAVLARTLQRLVNDRVLRAAVGQGQFAPLPYAHVTEADIRNGFLSNSERGFWTTEAKQWAEGALDVCIENLSIRYAEIL